MDCEGKIRELFQSQRTLEAEVYLYNARCRRQRDKGSEQLQKRIKKVRCILEALQGFYLIMSEDEEFVVKRHLVDAIDWPRISVEYEQKWGREYAKSERTLINYQKRALSKVAAFIEENRNEYDFSWVDEPPVA